MEFENEKERGDEIKAGAIANLEKRLSDKQLELIKLYEGDDINPNVLSAEELKLRTEIEDLDRALLRMRTLGISSKNIK
ncbi:MAG TPA: hypothetical protein VK675_02610 [Candidatus Paceibacterota bacterium]|nr:hypothetical protein [Candidatus Paceibacterota bacterium]